MRLGLGLLGTPKGQEWAALGKSGMNALNQRGLERTQLQTQRGQNLTQAMGLLGVTKQLQAQKDTAAIQQDLNKIFSGGGTAPGPAQQFQQPGGAEALMDKSVGGGQPAPVMLPVQQMASDADKYRKAAAYLAQRGDFAKSKIAAETANELEKQLEYSTTPQQMTGPNGELGNYLINKKGDAKLLGQGVKPEYKEVNDGQKISFYDPNTNKSAATSFQRKQDPNNIANLGLGYANLAESKREHDLVNARAENDSEPMSEDAKNMLAVGLGMDGKLPPMGMGKAARMDRKDVFDKLAAADRLAGISPEDRKLAQISGHTGAQAMAKLTTQAVQVGSFTKAFEANADMVAEFSKKLDRTGVPVVNQWIMAGNRELAGNPEVTKFDVAIKSTINEFTKIVSGSMGNTPMAEGEIKKNEKLLNNAQTPEQVTAALATMRRETDNRMKGFKAQADETLAAIRKGSPTAGGAAPRQDTVKTIKFSDLP